MHKSRVMDEPGKKKYFFGTHESKKKKGGGGGKILEASQPQPDWCQDDFWLVCHR